MSEDLNQRSEDFAIFSTAYLPSVEYLMLLKQHSEIDVATSENWQKQTVRNRCFILSPNGVQTLIIPVKHGQQKPVCVKDVRISYDEPWIRLHKGAIQTAYNGSAYFEFLKDDLWSFYDRKFEFLIDLNHIILDWLLRKFKIKAAVTFDNTNGSKVTSDYSILSNASSTSLQILKPENFNSYPQVFGYKHPFQKNLSSLDLLSCGGKLI